MKVMMWTDGSEAAAWMENGDEECDDGNFCGVIVIAMSCMLIRAMSGDGCLVGG